MRILILFAASWSAAIASAADLPFRPATKPEIFSLSQSSVIATPLNQTEFTTAATVTVQKLTNGPSTNVDRATGALSAVYKSAISAGTDPNPHPVPPDVQGSDLIFYEVNHDSVQAWASMSELGTPFAMVWSDGQSHGQAAASWSTRYSVQGTGDREVFVQFHIPQVRFDDRFTNTAPSPSKARLRINFLVNAYPAWSTEAVRFNELYIDGGGYLSEKEMYLESFGSDLGLNMNTKGVGGRTVTTYLGIYPAGKQFDFTLLFQVEAKVDSKCKPDVDGKACGNAMARVHWEPNAPQPTFYSKPVH